jgi:hypothetical protein
MEAKMIVVDGGHGVGVFYRASGGEARGLVRERSSAGGGWPHGCCDRR